MFQQCNVQDLIRGLRLRELAKRRVKKEPPREGIEEESLNRSSMRKERNTALLPLLVLQTR